jgi:hypothetical protein
MDLERFIRDVGRRFATNVFNELPSTIKVNIDPIRDYLLDSKKPDSVHDIVEFSGKKYRKRVMEFTDDRYNYNQY